MPEPSNFAHEILKSKKEFFINTVRDASKKFGISQPIVRFWNCPNFSGHEIAHCHTNSFTICISESVLSDLDNSEIYETATHEVTHLIHKNHDVHFHNIQDALKIASFKPERGGIVQISEKELSKTNKDKNNYSPNKRKCNYIQSKEHIKNTVKECIFCKRFFCEKHLTPRPILYNQDSYIIPYRFEKEVNNQDSHPCPNYTLVFLTKIKKFREEENKKINNLLRKNKYKEFSINFKEDNQRKKIVEVKPKTNNIKKSLILKKKKSLFKRIKNFLEN